MTPLISFRRIRPQRLTAKSHPLTLAGLASALSLSEDETSRLLLSLTWATRYSAAPSTLSGFRFGAQRVWLDGVYSRKPLAPRGKTLKGSDRVESKRVVSLQIGFVDMHRSKPAAERHQMFAEAVAGGLVRLSRAKTVDDVLVVLNELLAFAGVQQTRVELQLLDRPAQNTTSAKPDSGNQRAAAHPIFPPGWHPQDRPRT